MSGTQLIEDAQTKLKQNSNWDGDPLPSHSYPKKKRTCLSACFAVTRKDQTVG